MANKNMLMVIAFLLFLFISISGIHAQKREVLYDVVDPEKGTIDGGIIEVEYNYSYLFSSYEIGEGTEIIPVLDANLEKPEKPGYWMIILIVALLLVIIIGIILILYLRIKKKIKNNFH